eukprot:NODE_574_length_2054_cov_49.759730_g534_i0.p1 GENE.NODE_574_length_2054_cov_49.759730_g534_i0~~NODE_574_length_2054_cov_49.759730_g534_i0.p1  ORF type:complete len:638 (+),score=98.85 NODE_574_length_2054_cov_49.759730_g534_i0:42-1916(+)
MENSPEPTFLRKRRSIQFNPNHPGLCKHTLLSKLFGWCLLWLWRLVVVLPLLVFVTFCCVLPQPYLLHFLALTAISVIPWMAWTFRIFDCGPKCFPSTGPKKVCVVGGGLSGVTALKEMREAGHDAWLLDERRSIGGLFNFGDNAADEVSVWRDIVFVTSPFTTCFSDLPPAPLEQTRSTPHWAWTEFIAYLNAYVERFKLMQYVIHNRRVEKVSRQGEQWQVCSRDKQTDAQHEDTYDCLVIATGTHAKPVFAQLKNQELFKGKIEHAAYYRGADAYKGKKVVVVGAGETAGDIVWELSKECENVYLSVRRGAFVIPRWNKDVNLPTDFDTCRVRFSPPAWIHSKLILFAQFMFGKIYGTSREAEVRGHFMKTLGSNPMSSFSTKTGLFVRALATGKAVEKPEPLELTEAGVTFVDGTSVDADVILLCTGFTSNFNFLEGAPHCASCLYKRVFSAELGPSVAWVGFARPAVGTIPVLSELQSRWAALVFKGERHLPSFSAMKKTIARHEKMLRKQFCHYERLKTVNYVEQCDRVADEIGCRPSFFSTFYNLPLFCKIVAGPMCGFQYRLHGPGARTDYAKSVLKVLPITYLPVEIFFSILVNWAFFPFLWLDSPTLSPGNTLF